jgi:hypothetical protein
MPVVGVGELHVIDVMDGAPGPSLQIVQNAAGFTFVDNVATPAEQSIAFTLIRRGLGESTANWGTSTGVTLTTDNGLVDAGGYVLGLPVHGVGDTAYLTLAQFGTATQMGIGATVENLAAYTTVARLNNSTAEPGATRNEWRGAWSGSSVVYALRDLVFYNGRTYVCVLAHTSTGGTAPSGTTASNTWWQLFADSGASGYNTATLVAYKRSVSSPGDTPGTLTYTFATAAWTPGNGWTATVPGGTDPVWARSATAYSNTPTDEITSGEWSTAVQVFANGTSGTSGLNVATVFIYQRTSTNSAPALPSATATYTFADGTLTNLNNGWTSTAPLYTAPNEYLWVSTATASAVGPTDTIASGEWATVRLLSANGQNGINAITVSLSNPSATVPCDFAGVPKSGAFDGAKGQITVLSGTTDVTASATFSRTTSNCTGTVNTATNTPVTGAKGYYEVTALAADSGTMTITVTYDGASVAVVFAVSKARDGAATSSATDLTIDNVTVTSYPATGQAGPLDISVGPNGTISVSFFGNYKRTVNSGSVTLQGKIQYREKNVGASWADVPSSETTGTLAFWDPGGAWDPLGNLTISQTMAGPASLKLYEFQFLARVSSGSTTATFTSPGTPRFSVQWTP